MRLFYFEFLEAEQLATIEESDRMMKALYSKTIQRLRGVSVRMTIPVTALTTTNRLLWSHIDNPCHLSRHLHTFFPN